MNVFCFLERVIHNLMEKSLLHKLSPTARPLAHAVDHEHDGLLRHDDHDSNGCEGESHGGSEMKSFQTHLKKVKIVDKTRGKHKETSFGEDFSLSRKDPACSLPWI